MPLVKRMLLCFSLNFKIRQALLCNLRTGVHGPTGPTCRASLAYLASAECCPPMQKFLDQQKVLSPFYGKAFDKPTWFEGLAEWVASLHQSTKNSCGCLDGGLMASGHVKSPSASTSHEGHMAKFHPLIHSASSDKRWAIRAVAARLDKLWVVSELLKTDFPPGEPSAARAKGPKRPLALADDNRGRWTNIGLADERLETLLKTSNPGEPSAPSGLQAQTDA